MRNNLLFIIAVLSLITILLIIVNIFFPNFGFTINVSQINVDKINNTLLSLSTSYITGYIIYMITIYLPNKYRKNIYKLFVNDIIYQFYYKVSLLYCDYYHDEIYDELVDFAKTNTDFVNYFLRNPTDKDNRLNHELLTDYRKEFIKDINLYLEYLSKDQLKLVREIRITGLIQELELFEKSLLKYETEILQKGKNKVYKSFVLIVLKLKHSI